VNEQWYEIKALLKQSPSWQSGLAEIIADEFPPARDLAALALEEHDERAADLPQACPWTVEQVLDHGFWPEGQRAR